MKLLLAFLILNCIHFEFCYGQTKERMMIPSLKEDKKVDSLIDLILKSKPYINRPRSLKNCFLTGVMVKRNDHSLYISLQLNDIKSVNRFVNSAEHRRGSLGCFIYKSHDTFLWTADKFKDLFSNTGAFTVFFDIYKSKSPSIWDGSFKDNSWHYLYKNNHIVEISN